MPEIGFRSLTLGFLGDLGLAICFTILTITMLYLGLRSPLGELRRFKWLILAYSNMFFWCGMSRVGAMLVEIVLTDDMFGGLKFIASISAWICVIFVLLLLPDTALLTAQTLQQRQQASKQSELTTMEALISTLPVAIVGIDLKGKINYWNDTAIRIFGWQAIEVIGLDVATLIIPTQYRDAHYTALQHLRETGRHKLAGQLLELTALHKDGHEFPIELLLAVVGPLHTQRIYGVARDISGRKLRVAHQQEIVESMQAKIKALLAGIAQARIVEDESAKTIQQIINRLERFESGTTKRK